MKNWQEIPRANESLVILIPGNTTLPNAKAPDPQSTGLFDQITEKNGSNMTCPWSSGSATCKTGEKGTGNAASLYPLSIYSQEGPG